MTACSTQCSGGDQSQFGINGLESFSNLRDPMRDQRGLKTTQRCCEQGRTKKKCKMLFFQAKNATAAWHREGNTLKALDKCLKIHMGHKPT